MTGAAKIRAKLQAASLMLMLAADMLIQMSFTPDAPEWGICCSGLNIEGVCTTPTCKAHGELVVDQKVSADQRQSVQSSAQQP